MGSHFNSIPKDIPGKPEAFELRISEKDLCEFRELLGVSKIGPATWWNGHNDLRFGVSREWLNQAKKAWLTTFDWRSHEEHINSFPNFKMTVKDPECGQVELHFAALFSAKLNAIPVIFLHGFPSSFLEFLPMMQLLADKYTPETLPYHIIVPSLPDYGLSSRPSQNVEMTLNRAARIMNKLMIDLGFGKGYIAQGGDLGSFLARILAVQFEECKAFHVNMLTLNAGETIPSADSLTSEELEHLERSDAWQKTGLAYALEHGTRPATIGLVVSSNPLALLAWIGEKFVEWVDQRHPFSLDTILATISLYWFTDTFPRSLYHAALVKDTLAGNPIPISKQKPMGYSLFSHDLALLPSAWAKQLYPNLSFFRAHTAGGHFAGMEQPKALLEDVEEFVWDVHELFEAK